MQRLRLCDNTRLKVLPQVVIRAIANLFCHYVDGGLWRVVELDNFSFMNGVMATIVQGILASSSPLQLQEMRLQTCSFDQASIWQLQRLYSHDVKTTTATTLYALVLDGYFGVDKDVTTVQALQDLVESSSSLHELHLPDFVGQCNLFGAAMRGLTSTNCAVKKLCIDEMRSEDMMTLIQAIPRFTCVTQARFTFACDIEFKTKLLNAFRLNRSVIDTVVKTGDGFGFDAADLVRLRNYNQRNEYLPQVLQSKTRDITAAASRTVGKLVPSLLAVSTLLDARTSLGSTAQTIESTTAMSPTMGTFHNVAALVEMDNHTGPTF